MEALECARPSRPRNGVSIYQAPRDGVGILEGEPPTTFQVCGRLVQYLRYLHTYIGTQRSRSASLSEQSRWTGSGQHWREFGTEEDYVRFR